MSMLRTRKAKDFLLAAKNIFKDYSFPHSTNTKKYGSFGLSKLLKSNFGKGNLCRFFYPPLIYWFRSRSKKSWFHNYFLYNYQHNKFDLKHIKISDTSVTSPLNENLTYLKGDVKQRMIAGNFIEKKAEISKTFPAMSQNNNSYSLRSGDIESQLFHQLRSYISPQYFRTMAKNRFHPQKSTMKASVASSNDKAQLLSFHSLENQKADANEHRNSLQQRFPTEMQMTPATAEKKQKNELYLNIPPVELSHLVAKTFIHAGLNEFEKSEMTRPQFHNAEALQKPIRAIQEQKATDVSNMADQVYRLIEKKIQIEKERLGKWY